MTSIVVGVAIPNGAKLRLGDMVDDFENTPMGARSIKKWKQRPGEPLTLAGNAASMINTDPRFPSNFGYRIHTLTGERAEYFLEWARTQPDDCWLIESKSIIWHEQKEHIEDEADDIIIKNELKGQFSPLDPNNLPNELRSRRLKMETAEDQRIKPQTKEPVAFLHQEKPRVHRIRRNGNGRSR
jgi:hypothetical protein